MTRGKEIAGEIHTIIERAVMKDGAAFGDIFNALESMFVFWLAFLNDSERAEAMRELQQHIPQMLEHANGFAAAMDNSDGVPNFHRH
jgi:hypothetical protein